jgi:hypothetical protein
VNLEDLLSSAINLDPTTPLVVTDPVEANSPYVNQVFLEIQMEPYGISQVVGVE